MKCLVRHFVTECWHTEATTDVKLRKACQVGTPKERQCGKGKGQMKLGIEEGGVAGRNFCKWRTSYNEIYPFRLGIMLNWLPVLSWSLRNDS